MAQCSALFLWGKKYFNLCINLMTWQGKRVFHFVLFFINHIFAIIIKE